MIAPVGGDTFAEAVRMGSEVFHTLRRDLLAAGHSTGVGDEGGFAPALRTAEEALDFVMSAIERTGYRPGTDIGLVRDPASSEFFRDGVYDYAGEGLRRTPSEHADYLAKLIDSYPVVSIEDPMAENDLDGWRDATRLHGGRFHAPGAACLCSATAGDHDGQQDERDGRQLEAPVASARPPLAGLDVATGGSAGMLAGVVLDLPAQSLGCPEPGRLVGALAAPVAVGHVGSLPFVGVRTGPRR
ncbi:hypothetical protein GCM10010353_43380 [Streptomyces chryseus]|nr:hypothetical protein GCM10010353_43380 [Streptomyces chryseus]